MDGDDDDDVTTQSDSWFRQKNISIKIFYFTFQYTQKFVHMC